MTIVDPHWIIWCWGISYLNTARRSSLDMGIPFTWWHSQVTFGAKLFCYNVNSKDNFGEIEGWLGPKLLILAIGWSTLWVGCPAWIVHPVIKKIHILNYMRQECDLAMLLFQRDSLNLDFPSLLCCAPVCSIISAMAEQNLI